jgi:hypothetical protein
MLVWNTADATCKRKWLNNVIVLTTPCRELGELPTKLLSAVDLLCTFWTFIVKIEKKKYEFHNFK